MKVWATSKGDFSQTLDWLKSATNKSYDILNKYGQRGVEALERATPKLTSLASTSWGYEIEGTNGSYKLVFHNYDIEGGYNVAILIQYGHGTGTGGYVTGKDFINPALQPIFDDLAEELWRELTK